MRLPLAMLLFGAAIAPALAQQQPPGDPRVAATEAVLLEQLKARRDWQAQAMQLADELASVRKELDALKKPPAADKAAP